MHSMGERRKRKSMWDLEEETRRLSGISGHRSWTGKDCQSNHDGGHYHEFSDSRTPITRKSRDHSGYLSWESIEEDPISLMNGSFKNTCDEKEMTGGKRYYGDMSPGYDIHDYIHTRDHDRSHLQRYPRRGRSRSHSRSRAAGKSPSRSYSKGRGRERERGFSRSRSRSYDNGRDYSRSHSPMGDYRRQSYGWSDRRNSSEKPSQICREYAAGSCRRGNQCRFLHPSGMSHRDGDLMEHDMAEDWRSRAELSRIPKHSYRRGSGIGSLNDISDPRHGGDEPFPNKNRSAVICKHFVRGKCRWGDTCRFSHHAASDDGFGQGTRNSSFDEYGEQQPCKTGKALCKSFAAGKCDRKTFRFSHEHTNLNDFETQPGEVTASASSSDMNKQWNAPTRHSDTQKSVGWGETIGTNTTGWNGPTWDDPTRHSDTQKSVGWGKITGTNTAATGDASGEDNREGLNLENSERNWEKSEHISSSLNREQQLSHVEKRSNYGGDSGQPESVANESMNKKQETLTVQSTWLQSQADIANITGHNAWQDKQNVYSEPLQQNLCPASHIQEQHDRTTDNKVINSAGSDAVGDMKESRYLGHQLFSGQSLDLTNGSMFQRHSLIPDQSDGFQNTVFPNPSNGFTADLNVVPEINSLDNFNMQAQTQNNQEAVDSPGLLESKVPQLLTNLLTSEHSAQLINSLVNTDQQFSSVEQPVLLPPRYGHTLPNPGIEVSSSRRRMVPPFPDTSGITNLVNITNSQGNLGTISLGLLSSMGNGSGGTEQVNIELGNQNIAQATVQDMDLEQGMEVDSKEKVARGPTLRQEMVVAKSEVAEGNKMSDEKDKDAHENKQTSLLDGHRKVHEGGSVNKDDKGMRLFKISLVDFVKEILKPKWKEGRMSREVHKAVVKKVVDKISSSIQADHIPKTQDKVDQYLSHSKPKITKLVQAYIDRCLKAES